MKTSSAMHAGYQQQVQVFDNCTTSVGQTHNASDRLQLDKHTMQTTGFSWTNTQCKRQASV